MLNRNQCGENVARSAQAPKKRWRESAVAQAVMEREGLADEAELQSWFIRRIEAFLLAHGRRLIGWDEILEGGLAPGAVVMSWRGERGGIEAANCTGHAACGWSATMIVFRGGGSSKTK